MINPVYLRTFMHLVETRHFTQTAQQLYMTQPGVSQHIQKLEAQLGTALLDRQGKSFELTQAGELLCQYASQQAVAESELLSAIAQDDEHTGECRLACSGSMAMLLYPQLLSLQSHYPGLKMSVEAAPNAAIVERVRSRESDIGLITQPVNDPQMLQEKIGADRLCLALPADAAADWDSLMALGFIDHPDGHHYAIQVLEANFAEDFKGMSSVPQSGYINQLSQILLPVSRGLGFTVIPKSSLDVCPFGELIRTASLTTAIDESVYLITRKHRNLPRRYRQIRALISEQLQCVPALSEP
ncbi:LysR family transcriptional regulator [Aliamphritea spongicola]|uniref:LysR family transcriptional regulator n=1 Tax=Aliamphritea spongicola TaxID=707589 RepID=UPI00196AD00D|nr:LysR family transcriptional regulator [Aliamphritea spongicola]MBN3563216.1 LysR family transcriptional regulator [Aliamphritea spongicola]